jgi:hypothetical protein
MVYTDNLAAAQAPLVSGGANSPENRRHPGVAKMVARQARQTFRRPLRDARARDAAAMAEARHD